MKYRAGPFATYSASHTPLPVTRAHTPSSAHARPTRLVTDPAARSDDVIFKYNACHRTMKHPPQLPSLSAMQCVYASQPQSPRYFPFQPARIQQVRASGLEPRASSTIVKYDYMAPVGDRPWLTAIQIAVGALTAM